MEFKLTEQQKTELSKLLVLTEDDAYLLFKNIEYQMEESFLPLKGKRNVVAKDKAVLLGEISKKAGELKKLLSRLDRTLLNSLDSELGQNPGVSFVKNKDICCERVVSSYPSISSKVVMNVIAEETSLLRDYITNQYGSGYMEKVIDGLTKAWWISLSNRRIVVSNDSVFIQYLTIVLDECSTEKLVKAVLRSKCYEQQTALFKSKRQTC